MRINLSEIAKLLLIYIIGILLIIFLLSCNPLKKAENKVLANVESVKRVRAVTDQLFPCVNDSLVFIHDSATVVETKYLRDTLIEQRNDTTFVNYYDTVISTKLVTKNINTVVTDKREVNKHIDTINAIRLREAAFIGQIVAKDKEIKQAKQRANKFIYLLIALSAITVLTHYLRSKF